MIKKRMVKLLMVIFMISGIVLSTINFVSIEAEAGTKNGEWEYNDDGTKDCVAPGISCDTKDGDAWANQ